MRIFKAIIISSLSIPILVFVIFFGVGLAFLAINLIQEGEYDKGWLGITYAGAAYSYIALLVSSIPTIVIGWPTSIIAERYFHLRKQVTLPGSALLGGIFLSAAGALSFKSTTTEIIFWLFLAGTIGGLINGLVFVSNLKPKTDKASS